MIKENTGSVSFNIESVSFNVQVAIVIRSVRTALGWNQRDLAAASMLSKPTIARIESLVISPRGDTINALLNAFRRVGVEIEILTDEVRVIYKKEALILVQKALLNSKKTDVDENTAVEEGLQLFD